MSDVTFSEAPGGGYTVGYKNKIVGVLRKNSSQEQILELANRMFDTKMIKDYFEVISELKRMAN